MVCPLGRVNTSDQPLIVVGPVLVIVMFSVRPVFHAPTAALTRQPADPVTGGVDAAAVVGRALVGAALVGAALVGAALVGAALVGGRLVAGALVGVVRTFRPRNEIA